MASSAINGAVYDSTMNVFFKLKYAQLYDAVLATPMSPTDVALGEIGWAVARGSLYSIAFLVTMAALGMTGSILGARRRAVQFLDRVRIRVGRDGGHDVHAIVGRLRVCDGVDASAVPVLGDVLPTVELRRVGLGRAAEPAVPRRRPGASAANTGTLDSSALTHVAVLVVLAILGLLVAARRVRFLLLK